MPTAVKFKTGSVTKLNTTTTAVDDGSLLAANDTSLFYYDQGGSRRAIGGELVATSSVSTGTLIAPTCTSGPEEGTRILCCINHQPSGNVSLKLGNSSSTAHPIYTKGSTQLVGSDVTIGDILELVYRVDLNFSGTNYTGWWCVNLLKSSGSAVVVSEGTITVS